MTFEEWYKDHDFEKTPNLEDDLQACWDASRIQDRESLAAWMTAHSFATGHGDSFEDLLKELSWQIAEERDKR